MSTEACKPPPMYDTEFYTQCANLVRHQFGIDLHRDLSIENSVRVYLYLIDVVVN